MLEKLKIIEEMGFSFYFQFTLTPYDRSVERNLPPKTELLQTFLRLSRLIGPECLVWRYDPVMLTKNFTIEWHLKQFREMYNELEGATNRCIFSFIDPYAHIGTEIRALSQEEMLTVAEGFSKTAEGFHLPLFTCAEEIDLSCFNIEHSACIDQRLVEKVIGCSIKAKKDEGQRPACGCIESVDIGVYDTCLNGCSYCYAVTSPKTLQRRIQAHDPLSPMLTGIPRGNELVTDRTKPSQKISQISFL